MSKELYIEEQLADLSDDTVVAITKQIHDLADLESRNSDRTNQFKLPPTKRNNTLMGFARNVQSSSAKPYRKLSVKFVDNGVETIPFGVGILDEASDNYLLKVYSGLRDLFEAIAGLKLSDLDLSAYDHEFNLDNVVNSLLNTEGYKYPLIDHGDAPLDTRIVDASTQRPALFVKAIWDQIFEEAGFEYEGAVFALEKFTKLLFPFCENKNQYFNDADLELLPYINLNPGAGDPNYSRRNNTLLIEQGQQWSFRFKVRFVVSAWTDGVSTLSFSYGADSPFNMIYNHPDTGGGGGLGTFEFELTSSGTAVSLTDLAWNIISASDCTVKVIGGEFEGTESNGQQRSFLLHIYESLNYVFSGLGAQFILGVDLNIGFGFSQWVMSSVMPDMLQSEFIKGIANMLGLFMQQRQNLETTQFAQTKEIYANIPNARNWTSLLHHDRDTWSLTYRLGKYAQRNYFKYAEDSSDDNIEPNLGRGFIDVDDETLDKETDLIVLPFAPTHMTRSFNGIDCPLLPMIEDGEFQNDLTPRILLDAAGDIDGDVVVYNDPVFDVTSVGMSYAAMCYFVRKDKHLNLSFDNNLLEENYEELSDILYRVKRFVGMFNLKATHIQNFDHLIPVYLDQFAAHFYVNKIFDFKRGSLTKVELIRM